jgi:DNA-binding response OmpR family regulator
VGKKILIVDDEPNIIKVLTSRLTANGYEVVMAEDGEEGLARARDERPDLVILDLIMPKVNGYKFSSLMRSDPELKNIPILILSAWVRDKQGEDVSVADVYMKKPFEAQDLLSRIHSLLRE